MKNYCAKVESSVVTEIIVADFDWVKANLEGEWHDLGEEPLTVGVGYILDGSHFVSSIVEVTE